MATLVLIFLCYTYCLDEIGEPDEEMNVQGRDFVTSIHSSAAAAAGVRVCDDSAANYPIIDDIYKEKSLSPLLVFDDCVNWNRRQHQISNIKFQRCNSPIGNEPIIS